MARRRYAPAPGCLWCCRHRRKHACMICGYAWPAAFDRDDDPHRQSLPAGRPSRARAGSEERIREIMARVARGESTKHPDDEPDFSQATRAPERNHDDRGVFVKQRRWMVRRFFDKHEYLSKTVATKDEARAVLAELLKAVKAGRGAAWEEKYGVERRGKLAKGRAAGAGRVPRAIAG